MPKSGIMNESSASAGIVWITPTPISSACASRRRRAARMPSGSPSSTAAVSETAVGREDVDHVHAAAHERGIRERELHGAHLGEAQAVLTLEPRPAVPAVEEAGVEGRPQPGMAREIADRAQAQARRRVAPDGEGIGVVEAERDAE